MSQIYPSQSQHGSFEGTCSALLFVLAFVLTTLQVLQLCAEEEKMLKEYFASNPDLIFACCLDLWKSKAGDHYLGIVVLFITEDWQLMSSCLGVKRIKETHTAAHIKEMTVAVLTSFNIVPKCFVADNASNQVLCNDLLADWSNGVGLGTLMLCTQLKVYLPTFRSSPTAQCWFPSPGPGC